MPVEALLSRSMVEPLTECPKCYARPFRSFMRGQVVSWWRRLTRRAARWCVICSECKEIVAYERIP